VDAPGGRSRAPAPNAEPRRSQTRTAAAAGRTERHPRRESTGV
jgi:hypothetical protein